MILDSTNYLYSKKRHEFWAEQKQKVVWMPIMFTAMNTIKGHLLCISMYYWLYTISHYLSLAGREDISIPFSLFAACPSFCLFICLSVCMDVHLFHSWTVCPCLYTRGDQILCTEKWAINRIELFLPWHGNYIKW